MKTLIGQYKVKYKILSELRSIPGVGKVVSHDLYNIKIYSIEDLKRMRAEKVFEMHNKYRGSVQDRCMLYVFRCAIDYANKNIEDRKSYKLNWWDFKDR
jgi:retron-type reverse transcriptase